MIKRNFVFGNEINFFSMVIISMYSVSVRKNFSFLALKSKTVRTRDVITRVANICFKYLEGPYPPPSPFITTLSNRSLHLPFYF